MNTKRCINCGTRLGDGVGIEFNTLKHISIDLVTKLVNWLKPIHVKPANRICEPCLLILKKCPKRLANNLICLGCGDNMNVNDRVELNKLELEICRSWLPNDVAVKHLTKVCSPCMNRVKYKIYSTKTEPEFISVENNIDSADELDCSLSAKSEPECTESNDEDCGSKSINANSNCSGLEDNTDQKDPIKEEIDIEVASIYNDDDQNNLKDDSDQNNLKYDSDQNNLKDDSDQNNLKTDGDQNNLKDNSDQHNSEDECVVNEVKEDSDCIKYKYHEEKSTPKTKDKANWGWNRSKYNKNDDSDEDYIPHYEIGRKASSVRTRHSKNQNLIKNQEEPSTSTKDSDNTDTITLTKYKRTFRIGCCIFNGCSNECVSLIPRTVRRKMIIDHNLYIPPLSRVCEEHLQDQNWEELLLDTTQNFTAYHCQDMKNIVQDACLTNLDFENIETVDSRLVRYWFDLNKSDFNRIYNSFPKLKRLKRPKTALALYLMDLQSTSLSRIALLAKIKEATVKRNVTAVKDIVKCDNFSALKDLFLNDD